MPCFRPFPAFFAVLGDNYDPNTKQWDPSGNHMIAQQDFWFVFGMTVFILIPWFTVREVKGERRVMMRYFSILTILCS